MILQPGSAEAAKPAALVLWYDKPAANWFAALPVGSGRLGAMVFGGLENERIQFNEQTLWSGGPHDYNNPEAIKHLGEVRRLIFAGQTKQADDLLKKMMGTPARQQAYQPLGDLKLHFPGHGKAGTCSTRASGARRYSAPTSPSAASLLRPASGWRR